MAAEIDRLLRLILAQAAAGNPEEAFAETTPSSLMFYPDGSIAYGLDGFAERAAAIFGSDDFTFVGADGSWRYKPLDHQTIVFVGAAHFTIEDHEHDDEIRTVTFYQTELFRRNRRLPRGWEQIMEQLAYPSPLLGDSMDGG